MGLLAGFIIKKSFILSNKNETKTVLKKTADFIVKKLPLLKVSITMPLSRDHLQFSTLSEISYPVVIPLWRLRDTEFRHFWHEHLFSLYLPSDYSSYWVQGMAKMFSSSLPFLLQIKTFYSFSFSTIDTNISQYMNQKWWGKKSN